MCSLKSQSLKTVLSMTEPSVWRLVVPADCFFKNANILLNWNGAIFYKIEIIKRPIETRA